MHSVFCVVEQLVSIYGKARGRVGAEKSAPANIYLHRSWCPGLGSGRVKSEGVLGAINELPGGSALRKATPFQLFSLITLVPVWISRALIDCL